jgi:hypothetical protein
MCNLDVTLLHFLHFFSIFKFATVENIFQDCFFGHPPAGLIADITIIEGNWQIHTDQSVYTTSWCSFVCYETHSSNKHLNTFEFICNCLRNFFNITGLPILCPEFYAIKLNNCSDRIETLFIVAYKI